MRALYHKCVLLSTVPEKTLFVEVTGEAVCSVRASRPLEADWKARIDEDVRKRGR